MHGEEQFARADTIKKELSLLVLNDNAQGHAMENWGMVMTKKNGPLIGT